MRIFGEHEKKEYFLKFGLILLSFVYFLSAMLPKHADFWLNNYHSAPFWRSPLDFYSIINDITISWPPLYPPAFYALQGAWLDIGSYVFRINIAGIYKVSGTSLGLFSLWAIIPTILALFLFVFLAYHYLENKWLSILCFGTITFVAVCVMGQMDIFPVLFIFLSLISIEKSFSAENYPVFLFLGFLSLGVSMLFKTYGALLLPAYILYTIAILKTHKKEKMMAGLILTGCIALFLGAMLIIWIPYGDLFQTIILGGPSNYLFKNAFINGIPPWLLGYIGIIYFLIVQILNKPVEFVNDTRYFTFFNFLIVAWFFISVYTHPQWWLLLVPCMLMVLDKFKYWSGYLLCSLIMLIFLLFPLIDRFTVYKNLILLKYPVICLNYSLSMIVITSLVALLLIWSFELFNELNKIDSPPNM